MDDWEQFHTNATLLKPAKHCHGTVLSEFYGAMKSHLEKQACLSIAILFWCLDSARV